MASSESAGAPSGSEKIGSRQETGMNPSPKKPEFNERFDPDEYALRKRLPQRFSSRKNDIYITPKTDFKAQLERCQKLLDAGYSEVCLHGLGHAVNRAINLALQIKRRGVGSLDVAVCPSTIEITDDLEPMLDQLDFKSNIRFVSAITIRIFYPEHPVTDF